MKTANAGLVSLLESGREFLLADLYTITTASNQVYRFTSFDVNLVYSGNTWVAGGPIIERGRVRTVIGLEVDTLDLEITPKDTDLLGTQSWFAALLSGALDSAEVLLERAYITDDLLGATVVGKLHQFVGSVAQTDLDRTTIQLVVNSPVELLNIQMPRNLYQAGCQHVLFDAGCSLSPVTWGVVGSVSGSVTKVSFAASLGQVGGYFDLGALQFATGALAGTKRTVKTWSGGVMTMLNPLPIAPSVGDSFTVWPGCNRTLSQCDIRFGNKANFKGFPFIPVPETAI